MSCKSGITRRGRVLEFDLPHAVPAKGNALAPAKSRARRFRRPQGPVVGVLVGHVDSGEPLVRFEADGSSKTLPARATVACDAAALGRQVLLCFEEGRWTRPIVTGVLQTPQPNLRPQPGGGPLPPVELNVDGKRLVLTAEQEILLTCGKASITLTRAGKVLIRGEYLLSRSAGVNRIKGGAVQIN